MIESFDFSDCQFINENMKYYTYYDFCDNCEDLKFLYNYLNKNAKLFYKWYVYANIHMNETFKNAIWDYLNGFDDEGFELMRLKRQYRTK